MSKHFISYLEKLDHVSPQCALTLSEEATILQAASKRASNRGLPLPLSNRLSYLCAVLGPGPVASDGLTCHSTAVLESAHPFGPAHWFVKVHCPGAAALRISFDESSEMQRLTGYTVAHCCCWVLTKPIIACEILRVPSFLCCF